MYTSAELLRKGLHLQWLPSDSENNYKHLQPDGTVNYGRNEVSYILNSHGFRCDEFDEPADLPVLFLGCSFTEGIGLPLNETWSHFLLNKIRSMGHYSGKKIPHWSLALGGYGVDTAARLFYTYGHLVKPKYVFLLLHGMHRREFCADTPVYNTWMPNANNPDYLNRLFSDPFHSLHETNRSITILNQAAAAMGSEVFLFDLSTPDRASPHISSMMMPHRNTRYIRLSQPNDYDNIFPPELQHLYSKPLKARDSLHPGVRWQFGVFDLVWREVSHLFLPDSIAY